MINLMGFIWLCSFPCHHLLKASAIEIPAGPIMTIRIAGNMKRIMGISSLTAIFSAISCARCLRVSRMLSAKVRSASAMLVPNRSGLHEYGDKGRDVGLARAIGHVFHCLGPQGAEMDFQVCQGHLIGQDGADVADLVGDGVPRHVQPHAGGDAYLQQVQGVGQVVLDSPRSVSFVSSPRSRWA